MSNCECDGACSQCLWGECTSLTSQLEDVDRQIEMVLALNQTGQGIREMVKSLSDFGVKAFTPSQNDQQLTRHLHTLQGERAAIVERIRIVGCQILRDADEARPR